MKKATRFLFATLMLSLGLTGFAFAEVNGENDPITVTFRVNTSTVNDTLTANNTVLMRGVFRSTPDGEFGEGDFLGQTINWGTSSLQMNNVGADLWELDVQMLPGSALNIKYFPISEDLANTFNIFDDGWEAGDPRLYAIPEDATEDMVMELAYWNNGNNPPFVSKEDSVALYFRVNMQAQIQNGEFDPEADAVGIYGTPEVFGNPGDWSSAGVIFEQLEDGFFYGGTVYVADAQIGDSFIYKFVVVDPVTGERTRGDESDNRDGQVPEMDSTFGWVFYNNEEPTEAERVEAEIRFAVNVDILEGLGIFSAAAGDRMQVPGGFNGWATGSGDEVASTMDPAPVAGQNVWAATYDRTSNPIVVGSQLQYKYFVNWSPDRFNADSQFYIPFLASGDGWEEPGSTGGGNRVHTITDASNQTSYNAAVGFSNYNGIDAAGLILSSLVEGEAETVAVTFRVDMTNALAVGSEISDEENVFNPATDTLYLLIEENILAFTQGIARGPGAFENLNPSNPDDRAFAESLMFSPVSGETNIYELTLDLKLPSVNSFGYILGWGQVFTGEGSLKSWNGGGFDAGRRHYQFITPTAVDEIAGSLISRWPAAYTLNTVEFTGGERLGGSPLVFETPPNYEEIATSIGDDGTTQRATEIALMQNYPNPFNPTTNIAFTLTETSDVTLTVYNILGQRVATLVNTQLNAGTHTYAFDGSRLASGMYIYRLHTGNAMLQRQMMLIK